MTNLLKKYEILIQSSSGFYRELSILAQSSSHARSIVDSDDIKKPNETIVSIFPSSFYIGS